MMKDKLETRHRHGPILGTCDKVESRTRWGPETDRRLMKRMRKGTSSGKGWGNGHTQQHTK